MAGAFLMFFGSRTYPGTREPAPLSNWNFSTVKSPRSSLESISTCGFRGRGGSLPNNCQSSRRMSWRFLSQAAFDRPGSNGGGNSAWASHASALVLVVWFCAIQTRAGSAKVKIRAATAAHFGTINLLLSLRVVLATSCALTNPESGTGCDSTRKRLMKTVELKTISDQRKDLN